MCDRCDYFFSMYRCNRPGECDCPLCQNMCRDIHKPKHIFVLKEAVGTVPAWTIRKGYTEVLTERQLKEANRRGFIRVLQGHGIWEDIPLEKWEKREQNPT